MNHLLVLIWLSGLAIIGSNLNSQVSMASSRAEHCVGKAKFVLTDRNRGDWFTPDSTDFRKIGVTAWYPAVCQSENDVPYIDARILQAYAESVFPDSIDFTRLTTIQTQVIENAAAAPDIRRGPVIIFSPGSKTPVEMYTFLLRELAANGYFVLAVSHFYSTPLTLPDGTFIPRNDRFFDEQFTPDVLEAWNKFQKMLATEASLQEKVQASKRFLKDFPATRNACLLAGDIPFLISEAERMNSDSSGLFYHKLDLDKVGGLGHSFGGAIIGQACLSESRIKAGINLDGWQFGDMIFKNLQTPFLLVRAGHPDSTMGFNDIVFSHAGHNFSQIWIRNTTHTSFTDLPYFADKLGIPETGTLVPARNHQIICKAILIFFAQHVLRENHAISEIADQYPEIILAGQE